MGWVGKEKIVIPETGPLQTYQSVPPENRYRIIPYASDRNQAPISNWGDVGSLVLI